jgi:hypothetical protein
MRLSCRLLFKGLFANRDEILDNHIQYVKDEVEIRIESLKIELDCLFETFKEELWEIKNSILKYILEVLFFFLLVLIN